MILPDIGFVLWDGSTVPADFPADALAFIIADEDAVAAMIRRPSVDTFLNLWVTSRFDLRNGSFFDLAARRPKARTRTLVKSLDKRWRLRRRQNFCSCRVAGRGHWRRSSATRRAPMRPKEAPLWDHARSRYVALLLYE